MIKSMTGFGRYEITDEKRKFTVELKSVNHRYLDANIRIPKKFNVFESRIRSLLKEYMERGKVDVYISYEDYTTDQRTLVYNDKLAAEYLKYLRQMAEQFSLVDNICVSTLSRYPDVFVMEEQDVDEQELWGDLEQAIRGACDCFVDSRIKEGEHLKLDLVAKLDQILTYVDYIEERSPVIMQEYRTRLTEKMHEILEDRQVDEARILTEAAIYADKVCVDEEVVRLKSHITTMREELCAGGAVGRKLDFIAQEMNREANTILSKANNLELADIGINLKTDIEKVREQIQNIE